MAGISGAVRGEVERKPHAWGGWLLRLLTSGSLGHGVRGREGTQLWILAIVDCGRVVAAMAKTKLQGGRGGIILVAGVWHFSYSGWGGLGL
jgi:hypothetical protein